MLTAEENELLSRVGQGTPAGELLRRYWYPVAFAQTLTEEQPTQYVRLLGEDLVLFRDRSGQVGLIQDHCAHRGASMLYGRVEERGIACAYHGWLYDNEGSCLETPAEPVGSMFHLTVRMRAYPVRKLAGLYWAYLGPLPAPEIPRYDILVRRDGWINLQLRAQVDCNYLQAMENSVDPAHLQILHQSTAGRGKPVTNTTRGFTDEVKSFDFYLTSYGIMKRREYHDGRVDEHPLIFPNILRQGNGMEIRVPRDDGHFWTYQVRFWQTEDGSLVPDDYEPEVVPASPHKDPPGAPHPIARYDMDGVDAQDYMAWETQGVIPDRSVERLATSDRGVILLRQVLMEQIELVRHGRDPMGVIRDPNHEMIDTNLTHSIEVEAGLFPSTASAQRKW
jgi:5,5'-dehydrodivanillate O-demethylase oxygenase subunit